MDQLVSIIITTYNRASLLGETLDSIISQEYKNWECIVIDDSSEDYTPELMEFYNKKDSRVKYFSRPAYVKKGATASRNFGFSIAEGEYINWFDSDDIMHPEYLKKQMNILGNSTYDCAVCNFSVFKTKPEEFYFTINNSSTNETILEDYITGKINLGIQCTLWKKSVVYRYSFDEDLFWAQELDFIFRIFKDVTLNVAFVDQNLIFLRRHDVSMTGNFRRFNSAELHSELKVRREILGFVYLSYSKSEILKKALDLYFHALKMVFLSKSWNWNNEELKKLNSIFALTRGFFKWKLKFGTLYILNRLKFKRIHLHEHFEKFYLLILKAPVSYTCSNES